MTRVLLVAIFALALFACSNGHAQEPRVRLFRNRAVSNQRNAYPADSLATKPAIQRFNAKLARLLDGPMTGKYRDPREVQSRYVGGFHQSQLYNVGIPTGDIGFRGNGVNWFQW